MTFRPLLGFLALLAAANLFPAEPAPFLLKGKVALGDAYVFNVKPAAGRAEWLALGETINGYTLAAFDHPMNTLTLKKGETTLQVPMDIAAIGASDSPADRKQRNKERMLRMKPALEAGQPIKGSVVTMVDGKAVAQTAEFVIGRETPIDGGGGNLYVVTPTLDQDGSVMYKIALTSKSTDGVVTRTQRMTLRAVAPPWGQFNLLVANHGFGFVPDGDGEH
jgi:hypothetical protein